MCIPYTKSLYEKNKEVGYVFLDDSNLLYNISTDEVCPPTTIQSILSLESLGKQRYGDYVEQRLVQSPVPIHESISNNKINFMKAKTKSATKNQEIKELKNLAATLSQLYVANEVRGGDTLEIFSHENVATPPSLSEVWYKI